MGHGRPGPVHLKGVSIFLQLTFITGFFGQNFDWMVSRVDSGPMFLVLGVGSEIVALLALLAFFRHRGWF